MIENEIMESMAGIEYGFLDENGNNIINDTKKWDEEFFEFYFLQSYEELLKTKCGVCFDQVEFERYIFNKNNVEVKTYFIVTYDNDMLPSHTFLTYEKNKKYYWFEHSWGIYRGIHEYNSLQDLLKDVKEKFINFNKTSKDAETSIYEYSIPPKHLSCMEFYNHCESSKKIEV